MKKNFIKAIASMLCALMLCGSLPVSAAVNSGVLIQYLKELEEATETPEVETPETEAPETETPEAETPKTETPAADVPAEKADESKELDTPAITAPIYLIVEGADELCTIVSGSFAIDGTVTAGDVIAELMSEYHPDRELVGLEDGYISSIDGVAAGSFGGWDGWMFAVKYFTLVENEGAVSAQLSIDVPMVGINDYPIIAPCQIVLYYADYGAPFAGVTYAEDGTLRLVTFTAVYDENYVLTAFDTAPLAGGTFTFTELVANEDGTVSFGEPITFTADENGMTGVDATFSQLPNGTYIGSAGKQSDRTAELADRTLTLPEVVRSSDIYVVFNEPDPAEEFVKKVELLLIGIM